MGILGQPQQQPQQQQQQQPLFVPSSPLSAPLLLSNNHGNGPSGTGGPSGSNASSGSSAAPSLVTYNTLLQSLVKAEPPQPLLALGLFESLCASACPYLAPDAVSFNLAIIAAGQGAWAGRRRDGWLARPSPALATACIIHPNNTHLFPHTRPHTQPASRSARSRSCGR